MMSMIILAVAVIVSFVIGAIVGVNNVPTVTEAITVLKKAEQTAQATLAEITAHKAS